MAKEVLKTETLLNDVRFIQRGFSSYFDFKHFDLSIEIGRDPSEMVASSHNYYLMVQRDKVCQSTDDSCLSAIVSEPLPLHGIHYWEFKIKVQARLKEKGEEPAEMKSEESKAADIENASGIVLSAS